MTLSAGRPRKPTAIKMLQGTYRKDQEPVREPEYQKPSIHVKPPVFINKYAKMYWKEYIQELINIGVITMQDIPLYAMLAEAFGEWRMYSEMLKHNPDGSKRTLEEYFEQRNYVFGKMPEFVSYNAAYDKYLKLAAKFGLSPSDRSKIDLGKKDNYDPLSDMLLEANQ